jgi:3-hydroxyacyl-CoA dehydrogenase
MGLTIEEVDKLTGPLLVVKIFRTVDVVGLDTLVHVANGLRKLSNDEQLTYLNFQSLSTK